MPPQLKVTSSGTVNSSLNHIVSHLETLTSQMEYTGHWRYYVFYYSPFYYCAVVFSAIKTLIVGLIHKPNKYGRNVFHFARAARERLPYMSIFTDRHSQFMREFRSKAMGYKALDMIYNYHQYRQNLNDFERRIADYWMNSLNAQAVRNRYRLVKELIMVSARSLVENKGSKELKLLSVASGSAQPVLEATAELKKEGIIIYCFCTDRDPEALEYAKMMGSRLGIRDQMEVHDLTASQAIGKFAGAVDIVEMVGFLDYLSDDYVTKYFELILKNVKFGTLFLTAHIHPNIEKTFLWFVISWPMKYRSVQELGNLLKVSGWDSYKLITEPHKIHTVVLAQKNK